MTSPDSWSCSSERRATSIGTAKPTPSPPPLEDLICWLMPMTLPAESTSGPPELPGLMAASVWIAPEIWKAVRPAIERSMAETTPIESDWRSLKGEPIAATGSPTLTWADWPSGSGRSASPSGSTFSSATSASGSYPRTSASTWLPSANSTKTCLASLRSGTSPVVTTWALVAISPSPLRTKPEPTPLSPPWSSPSEPRLAPSNTETTVTTPGDSDS